MNRFKTVAARSRLACGAGCLLLFSLPRSAVGQQFREVAVGWTSVGPIPTETGTAYTRGLTLRAAAGSAFSQRFRLAVDGMAVFFDRNEQYYPPCPSTGCPHPFYDQQSSATIGVGGHGQLSVDPRGRFFLDAGVGEYATFLYMTEFRIRVSGGAGIAMPLGARLLAVVQADWYALLGQTSGPRNLFPISLGLRF